MKKSTIDIGGLHPKIRPKVREVILKMREEPGGGPLSIVVVQWNARANGWLIHRDAFGEITVRSVWLEMV